MKKKTVRITLDLGPVSYKRLTQLTRFLDNTKIGVIKQALELLERIAHALEKGYSLVMVDRDGNQIPVMIIGLNRPSDEVLPQAAASDAL